MGEMPSWRLVEQRIRNRLMEEAWSFARGDEGVRAAGPVEYFESFFDLFGGRGQTENWAGLPTLTVQEHAKMRDLMAIAGIAYDEWKPRGTAEDLIATGWPAQIAPIAQDALDLMLARGRFDEENVEAEPSTPIPWPPG